MKGTCYLPESAFDLEALTGLFWAIVKKHWAWDDEVYYEWTSDPNYLSRMPVPGLLLSSDVPQMTQFKIGENVFFLWRQRKGEAHWEVIRGKNLFDFSIDGTRFFFAMEVFIMENRPNKVFFTYRPTEFAEERQLEFVVKEEEFQRLSDPDVVSFFLHYAKLFPLPTRLRIQLTTQIGTALGIRKDGAFWLPLIILPEIANWRGEGAALWSWADLNRDKRGQLEVKIRKGKELPVRKYEFSSLQEMQTFVELRP